MLILVLLLIYAAIIIHGWLIELENEKGEVHYPQLEKRDENWSRFRKCVWVIKISLLICWMRLDLFCYLRYRKFELLVCKLCLAILYMLRYIFYGE